MPQNTKSNCDWSSGIVKDTRNLDGCKFLIQLKDSVLLEPINLSEIYKVDEKEICFQYKLRSGIMSICMKGRIVEIINIK